ncbi:MAG: hypothetical protein K2X90_01645 [Candidatus Babeliaceae bacterium]|nr:hypothetical protein [Candidatus Babeliaceae bacterium]
MVHEQFNGNILIFQAFDVGDDINFSKVLNEKMLPVLPSQYSKYFKNYHIPLTVAPSLLDPKITCNNAKLHNFGVITLRYQIPFSSSFEDLKSEITAIDTRYETQSLHDAFFIFNKIKGAIKQSNFFHLRKSYTVIQINPQQKYDVVNFKDTFGSILASTLRFETETLSEYQKNEILASAFGYYRGDLIIVDTEAACVYDDDYEDILELFEFANMQQLELQYFDRVLDKQLNTIYERQVKAPPFKSYLPFISVTEGDPIGDLEKLKVDISVITERLENSIKVAGEAYYSELYQLLTEKLDLANWKESINRKLYIIQDIATVYQNKIDAVRGDILSVAIIILIALELIILIIK